MNDWQLDLAILIIRLVFGFAMFYHGATKLFGWFGGQGLEEATALFARLGYRPPRLMAAIAAILETVGGILLILGLLTPVAVVALLAVLTNVILFKLSNGYDARNRGFEYEISLFAAVAAVGLTGPRAFSIDTLLGVDLAGFVHAVLRLDVAWIWGVLLIVAGVVGGVVVSLTKRPNRA